MVERFQLLAHETPTSSGENQNQNQNAEKRARNCKSSKKGAMAGCVSPPWKALLLKALDSNSHLKHSSFFQLVKESFPCLLFSPFFVIKPWFHSLSAFVFFFSGDDRYQREAIESYRCFQVSLKFLFVFFQSIGVGQVSISLINKIGEQNEGLQGLDG